MTDRDTERQKLIEAMARAIFDAEWDRPGNAATESEREPMWRVFRRKYCQHAEAALTAIAEQGYAVVPRIPGAETVASLLAGNAVVRAADVDGRLLDWLVGADLAVLPNNRNR